MVASKNSVGIFCIAESNVYSYRQLVLKIYAFTIEKIPNSANSHINDKN